MESEGEVEAQALEFQKLEEIFEDRDGDVLDTIISFVPFHQLKYVRILIQPLVLEFHSLFNFIALCINTLWWWT